MWGHRRSGQYYGMGRIGGGTRKVIQVELILKRSNKLGEIVCRMYFSANALPRKKEKLPNKGTAFMGEDSAWAENPENQR